MNQIEIIEKLNKVGELSQKLELSLDERNQMLKQVADYSNEFIEGLPSIKGFIEKEPKGLEIKDNPMELADLLKLYQSEVAENGINAASSKHLGYIPGGGVYTSALADYIAAITNPFASAYFASPGAATIENEVIEWLKNVFGFPKSSAGCLNSGGSISTLIAFTAARDKHQVKNEKVTKSVVYLSEQVHHSTQKALRIIGLEDVQIRYIPLDANHKIKTDALQELIQIDKKNGLYPFMVVATAGTTDTGTIDPLDAIADIAEYEKMWFHVDGAYGGFFILSSKKERFKGIERADSMIVDPHKGLFLPYGVGAVLVRDSNAILHSHYYTANYMQDGQNEDLLKNPANLSPELTKHFRGLRVWMPLQLHGVEPFAATLEEKLLLVHYFRNQLIDLGFKVGPEPDLSVSYFWYPFGEDEDAKNQLLMNEIHKDGSVFLSSSMIDNRFVIRMAVLAFRTKKETIDEAVEMIKRCLDKIK